MQPFYLFYGKKTEMNYIIFGLVLIFIFNSITLLIEKKYIINVQFIEKISFSIYLLLFILLYTNNFSRLDIFIKKISFMDLLFVYFLFIFFYQFCGLIKILSQNKIEYIFNINKNKLFADIFDIIHLLLFTSIIFPVLDLQFSQADFFLMFIITLIYFLDILLEAKNNILNIKLNIIIENSVRCFFSLVVHQACQNLFVVFLFILITKIYDYYKFTGFTQFIKEIKKHEK